MYTVYMHINKDNGKKYIGITSQKPERRWSNGAGYKGQKRFHSAIVSHGWNNFEHIIIAQGLTKEEAKKVLGVKTTAHISQCCQGIRGKAYGYMWGYDLEAKEPYKRSRKRGSDGWLAS